MHLIQRCQVSSLQMLRILINCWWIHLKANKLSVKQANSLPHTECIEQFHSQIFGCWIDYHRTGKIGVCRSRNSTCRIWIVVITYRHSHTFQTSKKLTFWFFVNMTNLHIILLDMVKSLHMIPNLDTARTE